MLDCYGCDRRKLEDLGLIYKILDDLPDKIGMHKVMPPYVVSYSGLKPEDWGISGVVIIAESHISIHTFPEKNYASVDIFSCKDFEKRDAVDYIRAALGVKKFEEQFTTRGSEFPKELARVKPIVERERKKLV